MDKKELNQMLVEAKRDLEHDFNLDALDRIETEEINKSLRRFVTSKVEPLEKKIDHLVEVIKSPVHVGMLGRYSHGKSALVNALFDLGDDSKLPEGDGVVTSKVTYVSFDKDLLDSEAYEVKKGGEEVLINLNELRNSVGRTDKDTSGINYYKLRLCAENKDFAQSFARQNINLVDMPGLGGPFFKDQAETRKYVRELDMIIAVIKIDEIMESGLHIDSLIDNCGISVIPVLTFYDKWEESKLYADCKSVDEMLLKAKKEVENNIPSLRPFLGNLIAVSAFTGHNIDALRNLIMNHIESREIAIAKSRTDISPVYRKQLREFQKEFTSFKAELEDLSRNLDSLLKPIIANNGGQQLDIVNEACKSVRVVRAKRALDEEANRAVNEYFRRYQDRIAPLQHATQKSELNVNVILNDVNLRLVRECLERVNALFQTYKDELLSEVLKRIEGMTLDNKTKVVLENDLRNVLESKKIVCNENFGVVEDQMKLTAILTKNDAKATVGFFAGMVKDPNNLMMLIGGVVLLFAAAIPVIGGILAIAGVCLIGVSIITALLKQPQEKKKFFDETKGEVVSYLKSIFNENEKKDMLSNVIERNCLEMTEDIKDVVSVASVSYNKDARYLSQVKENVQEIIDGISNKLEDELCKIAQEKR